MFAVFQCRTLTFCPTVRPHVHVPCRLESTLAYQNFISENQLGFTSEKPLHLQQLQAKLLFWLRDVLGNLIDCLVLNRHNYGFSEDNVYRFVSFDYYISPLYSRPINNIFVCAELGCTCKRSRSTYKTYINGIAP